MPGEPKNNDVSQVIRALQETGIITAEEVERCRVDSDKTDTPELAPDALERLVANGSVTAKQIDRMRTQLAAEKDRQIPGYQLLDKLGEGAMARVFKARQISLDRIVAIKVLPQRYMSDAQFVDRFYAEGRAAAKLNPPNIVQAFDVGQAGDFHYFVMEYVEGDTVYDHLQQRGRYDEADALNIITQIAEALRHAHEKGFIHRDVKPKNIMITTDGVAKLADMGLARQATDTEAAEAESGRAYGTPYYISPEQIRGEVDVDFRADIYSLGATYYHMLTGRVPFDGPNPSAVMRRHLRQTLVPPDHVNAKLSSGISAIIEMMMAKDRQERYASTADLLDDLHAVGDGGPPLQARRNFDFRDLVQLEGSMGPEIPNPAREVPPLLTEQPLFWVAVASLTFNAILVIVLVLLVIRGA
ncbi:MAG: serine/threonine protein kinase [Planctomycetaceae bacterium]|nr:serine/threonine protein kinase [Planctomycetaceae bacterium]